jgi:hypothetical protein
MAGNLFCAILARVANSLNFGISKAWILKINLKGHLRAFLGNLKL